MIDAARRPPAPTAMWVMFVATSLAMIGNYYVYDSIGPVADLLSRQLGWSDTQIGMLNAVYSFPNIIIVLIGGVLVDRYSARALTVAATVVFAIGAVVTAMGDRFP